MAAGVMEDRGVTKIWKTQDILQSREPSVFVTLSGYHQGEVSAVAFSADGQLVATGARDGRVAVWALSGCKLIAGGQLHAKNTIISHMEWLPDGDLITAGFDGRLQRLNVDLSAQRLTTVTRFEHDRIPIERVSFSPDRQQFVTISVRTDKVKNSRTNELETKISYEMQLWAMNTAASVRRVFPAIIQGKTA